MTHNANHMTRQLAILLGIISLLIFMLSAAHAEEILFGTVERVKEGSDDIAIIPAPDRPKVAPEELVKIQTRIPGIDEIVESGRGYIIRTDYGRITIKRTHGEPALGDEVILLRGQFLNGREPIDENKWVRMGHDDVQAASGKNPPNVGAICTFAQMYELGREVEKNARDAMLLHRRAMNYNPSAHCAYRYGFKSYYGDSLGNPPAYPARQKEGEKWIRYAAELGDYTALTSYASILYLRGEYRKAEKWLKKAIKVEPRVHKGSAQETIDRYRKNSRIQEKSIKNYK
jgi:hypothetical protein